MEFLCLHSLASSRSVKGTFKNSFFNFWSCCESRCHALSVHCPIALDPVSDEEFESIDRVVMSASYSSQNHLGRLCNERVYENDVVARLRDAGFGETHTQVPVTVTHQTYLKTYWLDLVAGQMIYELKSVDSLASGATRLRRYITPHWSTRTGSSSSNSRLARVTGQILRTPFPRVNRRQITVVRERWECLSDECGHLFEGMLSRSWKIGARFSEAHLYSEGLAHFFGGETQCVCRLPVCRDGIKLGTHRLACHSEEVGFIVTALGKEARAYEEQLRRLLSCLPLHGIQWLNLNHTELRVVTLVNRR